MSLLSNLQAFITAVGADIKALTAAVNNSSLPSQTGKARKVLKTNASSPSWEWPATLSSTPGAVPAAADLGSGEQLINTNDGKVYFKKTVSGADTVLVVVGQNVLGSNSPMWTTDAALMWTQ